MIVLYILLAIILLITVILSIKVSVIADYSQLFSLKLKYLFMEIPVYPGSGKKKPAKEKKEEAPKEEKPQEEKPPADKGGKNPIKNFLDNEGVSGVIGLINDTARILGGFFGSIFRHVIFDELFLTIVVAGSDAADTAIKYGKISSNVFPAMGYICSHAKVKKYDVDVSPDFLAERSTAEFHVKISFRPIFLVGAALVLAVKMLFKVVFKLLFSKPKSSDENINKNKIKQGGAQ